MSGDSQTFLTRRRGEIRHGLRITIAGVLSFALALALGLPQGYWAVFTAVLVVQSSVGGSWKASVDRLLGTMLGAVYGAMIATAIPHQNAFMLGTALAISLAPLALLAALNPSYRVAPITAIILLLGNAATSEGPFIAAFMRTLEVSLGGLVGMTVSLFVLPARAHALLGEAAGRVLQRLADLFSDLMSALTAPIDAGAVLARNDAVRVALTALEAVSDEAARERRNYLSDDSDPEPVTRTLRRVRHDLILIGRVAAEPLAEPARTRLKEPLSVLSQAGTEFLRGTGQAFVHRLSPRSLEEFDRALAAVVSTFDTIKGDERLVALDFGLEQLRRNLGDLCHRAQEFARLPVEADNVGSEHET